MPTSLDTRRIQIRPQLIFAFRYQASVWLIMYTGFGDTYYSTSNQHDTLPAYCNSIWTSTSSLSLVDYSSLHIIVGYISSSVAQSRTIFPLCVYGMAKSEDIRGGLLSMIMWGTQARVLVPRQDPLGRAPFVFAIQAYVIDCPAAPGNSSQRPPLATSHRLTVATV